MMYPLVGFRQDQPAPTLLCLIYFSLPIILFSPFPGLGLSPSRATEPFSSEKQQHATTTSDDDTSKSREIDRHLQLSASFIPFIISEPENLRYTFRAKTSRIGEPFTKVLENIPLVLAEPRAACSSIINKLDIKNNLVLVERGVCTFLEKCIEIERSGGIGMIVYDNDKNNSDYHIEMIDDSTPRNCSIPAVYLVGKDGHMIVQSLLALRLSRAIVTIPLYVGPEKESPPPWSNERKMTQH